MALRDAANQVFSAALDAVVRLSGCGSLHSVPLVGDGPAEMVARMCLPEDGGLGAGGGGVRLAALGQAPVLLPDSPGLTTFLRGLKMA